MGNMTAKQWYHAMYELGETADLLSHVEERVLRFADKFIMGSYFTGIFYKQMRQAVVVYLQLPSSRRQDAELGVYGSLGIHVSQSQGGLKHGISGPVVVARGATPNTVVLALVDKFMAKSSPGKFRSVRRRMRIFQDDFRNQGVEHDDR